MKELKNREYGVTLSTFCEIMKQSPDTLLKKIEFLNNKHSLGIELPEHLSTLEYFRVRSYMDRDFADKLLCYAFDTEDGSRYVPGDHRRHALVRLWLDYNDVSGYRLEDIAGMLPGYLCKVGTHALSSALRMSGYTVKVTRVAGQRLARRWCKIGKKMPEVKSPSLLKEEIEEVEGPSVDELEGMFTVYDYDPRTPAASAPTQAESQEPSTPEPEEISFM